MLAVPATAQTGEVVALKRTDRAVTECETIDALRLPTAGGCVLKAESKRKGIDYTVVTPFGSVPFAPCGSSFTARIARTGDAEGTIGVLIDTLRGDGSGEPCGDLQFCIVPGTAIQRPWNGVVHLDKQGGAYMDVNVCLDTCMGWFEGKTRFELDRVDGTWRIRARKAMVGDSGIEMDGEWKTGNGALRLEPAPEEQAPDF
jgi:hypothetical protein